MTRTARNVAFAPPSAHLPFSDASGSSCVSGPVLAGVGDDTRSWRLMIGPGVLKGLFVILSSWLKKEGRTRGLGVTTEIGSGVTLEGGVGSSLIRSTTGSSSPVCIVLTRTGCGVVSTPYAWLCSSSSSFTTSTMIVLTGTSLGARAVSALRILGEVGCSGAVGTSSSLFSLEGPG